MTRISVPHNGHVNRSQLADELAAHPNIPEAPTMIEVRGGEVICEFNARPYAPFVNDVVDQHVPTALSAVVTKARQVLAGDDTFTDQQLQKLVARLVLHGARDADGTTA